MGIVLATGLLAVPAVAAEISEGQIAQAKAVLELRPDQQPYWPRVASAIRSFSRETTRAENASASVLARTKASSAQRVLAAAGPLINTMNARQKQVAASIVGRLGFGVNSAGL